MSLQKKGLYWGVTNTGRDDIVVLISQLQRLCRQHTNLQRGLQLMNGLHCSVLYEMSSEAHLVRVRCQHLKTWYKTVSYHWKVDSLASEPMAYQSQPLYGYNAIKLLHLFVGIKDDQSQLLNCGFSTLLAPPTDGEADNMDWKRAQTFLLCKV